MNVTYTNQEEFKEFQSAREHFGHIVGELTSEHMLGSEHGEVEAMLDREGKELLRRLLQGFMDVKANKEERVDCILGSDGVERTHVREGCERQLESLFGEVDVRRMGYSARGSESLYPMDAELNLPPNKYSHGLGQRSAEEALKVSFEGTVCAIEKHTGGKVPKRQTKELVGLVSQDFEQFYEAQQNPELKADTCILVLSEDGKGIVMRQKDLREATRKAAERQEKQNKACLSPGNKKKRQNRKRMAAVASVYDIEPHLRNARDIIRPIPEKGEPEDALSQQPDKSPAPRPQNKRVWASVERDLRTVTEEVFQEALRRDPQQKRLWVMLIDGQPQQLQDIKAAIKRHKVNVILVLDFIHVLEYLWKAAYCFYDRDKKDEKAEAERWVSIRALAILEGQSSTVAAGMRRSATKRGMEEAQREAVDDCADYLLKYRDMLRYDEFLRQGFPIASGVIEGACRHLINDRLGITGARWGLQSAEGILKLRALNSSGDLDAYWRFHSEQELKRNHQSRFAACEKMAA